ncbi:COG1470 family protein [Chryseobacterium terrae]|uniref:SD-repeat containing protein B domain-containing protein n=1 Tax=Chryseobacterium terrae TaxID=3163299 RepID=A0ABW8XWZ5_9FLAO
MMEIEQGSSPSRTRLLNLVVAVQNLASNNFSGKLQFECPKGFKIISGEEPVVELRPKEKKYIPVRIIVGSDAKAGSSPIKIRLLDQLGILITERIKEHVIDVNNDLNLALLNAPIYRSSGEEPISVKIRVSNLGNISQDITLVCKIPDPENGSQFLEQQALINVKKDSIFTFTYQPSKGLARLSNFSINVSGFRNPDKEIFNSATVFVQNISSVQKYQDPQFNNFAEETKNHITTSYRKVGDNIDMYQLIGSGGFNLPSGYLHMRGNIALLNSQELPLVTNTNIVLQQGKNQYSIGSVNRLLEMALVGRGAEYSHTFGNDKKLEVGFADQNFNLVEKNSFLKYGYGFFTKGTINTNNNSRNFSATYIYRYDPFEKSKHSILGTEANYVFNKIWSMNAKVNGGLSSYETQDFTKPSFSAESNYIGAIKDYNLNGNYFFSSGYYPGNRRGSVLLQQNISKNYKNYNFFTNFIFSNFSPKYYFFDRPQISENTRFELGTKFPKVKNISFGLFYQFQNENSNSYNNFFGTLDNNELKFLTAHRLVEQISWSNYKTRQSAIFTFDTGIVKYPLNTEQNFQMKLNGNYSFRSFNINAIYQSGSYYLSEFAFSHLIAEDTDYKKLTLSLFYNENFLKNKFNLSTGLSYVDDIIYGKSPSAFINAKYNGKKFGAFLNSSWYNYSAGVLANNIFTFELGLTLNLRNTLLDPDKKGKIQVLVFYDENNNNIFDLGEKTASDYIININNVALKTTEDGTATYKNVPFGKYRLKQFIQQGWYYDEYVFNVDSYSYPLNIPLHQNGTLQGKIFFDYNSQVAVDFEHRASSVSFQIIKEEKIIQRTESDDEGKFNSFLPTGKYTIVLDQSTLPANTYCETKSFDIDVKAGELVIVPDFIIKVREKKVNKKTFSN